MVVKHTCNWLLTAVKIVKIYTCDVCHKHVQRSSTLFSLPRAAKCVLDGSSRERFRCSSCKQSFGQKECLLVHKRRHSKSKPYICVRCNVHFVTRAGLEIHKIGHTIHVTTEERHNDNVIGSDLVQHQEQYQQSQICVGSKSQNVVSQCMKIEKVDTTKRVLVITNNSPGKYISTGIFGEKLDDSDEIRREVPHILAPESYSSKVDIIGHKSAPEQWHISNQNNIQNQHSAGINITSSCVNQGINVSLDVASFSCVNDDCLSNHRIFKKKIPEDGEKKTFLEIEYKKNSEETFDNGDWCPSMAKPSNCLSNITLAENAFKSAESFLTSSKLEKEHKEIKIGVTNNVHDRRPCTRMKTKSRIRNDESPQPKVPVTRIVTRSHGRKLLSTKVTSNQSISEIIPRHKKTDKKSRKKTPVSHIMSRHIISKPESSSWQNINPSKEKKMIVAGLEESCNVEIDPDIKSLLKKDGVEKVSYFQCSMCSIKHLSEQDLENHEKLHFAKKTKLHQCEICRKMCSDSTKLEDHRRLHTGEKPFICKICTKRFRMKACLNIHMRVHTKEKSYHCSICSKEFTYRNTLNRHLARHQSSLCPVRESINDEKVKCENCEKLFRNLMGLQKHHKNSRKCDICSQVFCSFSALVRHKNTYHVDAFSVSKSDGTYCQFCKKTFKSNYIFLIHMQKHMRNGMPITFPCPICSELFDSYDLLRVHRKTHTVKREKCITCPWSHCGKMLTSQTRLNSHLKRHNGETLYLCHRCGMHFTDCVFYLKHRRACYQRITTYDCPMCGKELSGYSSLQRHIMSHTGERPYQCEVCGSRFIDNAHLKRHKRIHVRKGEMLPFENVSSSERVNVDSVLCLADDPQSQDDNDYATCLHIGNEQVVAYCVEEQNCSVTTEQSFLRTELLRATESVAKEIQ